MGRPRRKPPLADPRFTGLRDAVRRGWYNSATGEVWAGFRVTRDDIVLDAGCGEGNAVLFCAGQGAHVVFTDVDPKKVSTLTEKLRQTHAGKYEGFVSDCQPIPLPNAFATKILIQEMLEHTTDPAAVLAELARVGQTGATYLISVPDARSERLQKPVAHDIYFQIPNHLQVFNKKRFIALVEGAGLVVERYDTWGFYWTVFMSLYWLAHPANASHTPVLDRIHPPYHPVLQSWADTWEQMMLLPGSEKLMKSFDRFLPKTQVIVAVKK
jgi:SAM-dependent methyltransferase